MFKVWTTYFKSC